MTGVLIAGNIGSAPCTEMGDPTPPVTFVAISFPGLQKWQPAPHRGLSQVRPVLPGLPGGPARPSRPRKAVTAEKAEDDDLIKRASPTSLITRPFGIIGWIAAPGGGN